MAVTTKFSGDPAHWIYREATLGGSIRIVKIKPIFEEQLIKLTTNFGGVSVKPKNQRRLLCTGHFITTGKEITGTSSGRAQV